jgi:hypothetical protein
MRSFQFLTISLASVALAQPTFNERSTLGWTAPLARFYQAIDVVIRDAKASESYPNPPGCDMSKASMPTAPSPLPSPDSNTYLRHVAIGRGIQVSISSSSHPHPLLTSLTEIPELYL